MSLRALTLCECGEPRHKHQSGELDHAFVDARTESDRQFIARLRFLQMKELERMLGRVREEWEWWCVQREVARRKK